MPGTSPTESDRDTPSWRDRLAARTTTRRSRGLLGLVGVLGVGLGSLALLWPALVAPLAADQRFMYLEATGRTAGSLRTLLTLPFDQIPQRLDQGRFAPLAYLVQWVSYNGVTELSMTSGTSVPVVQALQKVVLLLLCLLAVVAFAAVLRARGPQGELVRLGRRALVLVTVAAVVLVAAGTQTQVQPRNGWETYAVLTYGAVVVDFGVVALVVWLARRLATGLGLWRVVGAVVVLALVAAGLNSSYELYYVAFPVAVVALVLQPVAVGTDRGAGRRAKLVVGGAFSVLFLAGLVAVRAAVAASCSGGGCYVGTRPKLDGTLFTTWWYNLGSSVPLTGRNEALDELRAVGVHSGLPGPFSNPLAVMALVAAVGLVLCRLALGRLARADDGLSGARTRLALDGALLSLLVALGSAAVMSLSEQAQSLVTGLGLPYRHTMVTWTALAMTVVMAVLALDLALRGRGGVLVWSATALVVALLAGSLLPANLATTRAAFADEGNQSVTRLYDELVLADPTPAGDLRRCEAVKAAKKALNNRGPSVTRMIRGAYQTYRYRYGKAYCSRMKMPELKGNIADMA
ncbi:hypothetical protein GCM10027446_18630 [Angustibacter peucedani]